VLLLMDGRISVAAVARATALRRAEVQRVLMWLVEAKRWARDDEGTPGNYVLTNAGVIQTIRCKEAGQPFPATRTRLHTRREP
jgi:hypothetical protein